MSHHLIHRQPGDSSVLSNIKRVSGQMLALALGVCSGQLLAQDLVITGVIDGPLSGGVPKAVELCVLNDIADLSDYGIGSANNGGGSDGEEFTFPAVPATAGTFLYVASEPAGFSNFFGFAPQYTSGAASINGDDAIELFMSSAVADVFGEISHAGGSLAWAYGDGWAYRSEGTGPDGDTFVLANWSFSGPNALDGETSNATATVPFPIGAYSACELPEPAADILLSEIVVTPTGGEFIEIYNPTAVAIDLSDVYLTDATFAGGGVYYYNIVTGSNAGGGGFSDFHARFPDGASIAPGEFQTVSLPGSDDFFAEYGFDPDYELFEDGAGPDGIADMREALPGSINNQGGLSNSGEVVILYSWDSSSDLVQDIDYALWGDAAEAVDKTGVVVDGPDADSIASSYLADTPTSLQDVIATGSHGSGDSFQRVDFTEGIEIQSGGNGVTGSDETSEDLSITWSLAASTPGSESAADWVINEIHADPASDLAGDANNDGVRSSTGDEFVEIINVSGAPMDISGWTLADGFNVRHTFPGGTVIPDQCGFVVFGGGTPSGSFGNMTVQTASSGSLGLNNGGDSVVLNNGSSDVASTSYGAEGGDNQSLTLDPDITGVLPYYKHSEVAAAGGALFSPGTRTDGSNFSGCPSPWVINEIHADPASGSAGDANGDGTRDFTDDEFVEIVNNSGADFDISGWTLADGFSVRHTFPTGSVVLKGCSVVVFGGGTPTGGFGNSLVQTASSGALGLNNGGDSITLNDGSSDVTVAGYGSEGGNNQSLTLDPDVFGLLPYTQHTVATGSGGALFSPGSKIDASQFDGCAVSAEIFEIQGSGASSPLVGKLVSTDADVVTALAPDGFFMQTPTAGTDADIDTSDGIFVFTGAAPGVATGDLVDVQGTVKEFFGFTEISSPSVNIVGTAAVPLPVVFDETVPSPDPASPSCSIEYECYEGMLIEITDGTVTGPNQRFGPDPIAEVHIVAGAARAYREPGIEFPGDSSYPEWDGNPEVFELDPDKLGLANQVIPAGSIFSATGVLGFEFGGYELWPSQLDVTPAPLPVSVRSRNAGEFTVGTLNLFRLFDDVDDPADGDRNDFVVSTDEYVRRLTKFAVHIVDVLGAPDILSVQEAEKLGVLEALATAVRVVDPGVNYTAYLIEGNDIGTIDVGFLVREDIHVDTITQVDPDVTFVNPITLENDILHDRPPLLLEGSHELEFGSFPIAVMSVHNRSLGGIDGSEGSRVRKKRFLQAVSIADEVMTLQSSDPDIRLVVTGDFNAFEFTDGYVDSVGIITGDFIVEDNLVCEEEDCTGLPDTDLVNEVSGLPAEERYSFIFRGSAQVLDHALTSQGLATEISGAGFGRGNADAAVDLINSTDPGEIPLRSSDHDGMVVYINDDKDIDGVPNNLDQCPGTVFPEGIPLRRLGINHWALVDGDTSFDTLDPIGGGVGPELSFTLGDTGGCSCTQIIDSLGLGKGHSKYGCSIEVMSNWADAVSQP
jgi:predicted extracellular nuclease